MPAIELIGIVDTLDKVPESAREFYEERDGQFVLAKPVSVELTKEVVPLRNAFERTKREFKEASDKLKLYDGVDPEEYRTFKSEAELRKANGGKDPAVEQQIAALRSTFAEKEGTYTKTISKLEAEIQSGAMERAANDALDAAGLGKSKTVLLPHLMQRLRAERDESGEYSVGVFKANGQPELSKATGLPMTPKELVTEVFANDDAFKPLFPGSGASGGGVRGSEFRGGGGTIKVSRAEASKAGVYQRLEAEAKKLGKTFDEYVTVTD